MNLRPRADQAGTVESCTQVLAALGDPGVGIVKRVHQPEDETVERLLLGQAEFFNHAHIFARRSPGWLAHLLQRQPQVWNVTRLDAHHLAANEINGEAVAPGNQHLQIGFIAIERSLAILADAAIHNRQVGLDTEIHIDDALVNAEGMHRAAVGARQNAHQVLHRQGHRGDDVRFQHRQINQARLLHNTWDAETFQAFRALRSQLHPILLAALRVYLENTDTVLLTKLFYTENGIGGIAIKFRSRRLT